MRSGLVLVLSCLLFNFSHLSYVCVCVFAGLLPKCWQQLKLELAVGRAECCSHKLNTGVHCVLHHHSCLLTVCISVCWSHEPEASIQPRHPNTPLKALTARPAPTSAQFLQFENLFHNLSDTIPNLWLTLSICGFVGGGRGDSILLGITKSKLN